MNQIRRITFLAVATVAIVFFAIPALAAVLPVYEFPNYGYSALMFCGAFAAYYFARRRLIC